jgi:hypothetical protein
MLDIKNLLNVADAYKVALGIERDTTVSFRVFQDSKKLDALRSGGDITVGRYRAAMHWFRKHWPEGVTLPDELVPIVVPVAELGGA